ncbi:HpcH/HpaI aldolase family protein [Agrococcus jejuensis]|uniref:4-hydroxy-2-oxoheptanedioate aldolase n=1 Tax=Agrococcus jejuensis TaxID=399736 RepID=A0A1G8DHM7_9MICO|nr:aldolase/citrate lyase family protein [Agrococcus jejuensis]SDH57207.1 4-hydroxy-2-oxoheptanedioate aldolase [Agrococcus jejuensis]
MPFHGLRDRVRDDVVVATCAMIPSPTVIEALSGTGFHAVLIDAEHSPIAIDTLEHLVRAADVAPIPAIVRVPEVGSYIARALDLGAAGLIVPRIETVEEAREVVDRARYAPEGRRGTGPGRGSAYGAAMVDHVARANGEILVGIQIETALGLANADDILAVPGIDVVVIGPFDLATSLGVAMGSPEHQAAIGTIRDTAKRHGVAYGAFTIADAEVAPYLADGATLLMVGADIMSVVAGARASWAGVEQQLATRGAREEVAAR